MAEDCAAVAVKGGAFRDRVWGALGAGINLMVIHCFRGDGLEEQDDGREPGSSKENKGGAVYL